MYRHLITKYLSSILVLLLVSSCGSKKKTTTQVRPYNKSGQVTSSYSVPEVVRLAEDYIGTPYRYGGVTRAGMDCSGLVYTVYGLLGKTLPRSSFDQSQIGRKISQAKARPGDLIFFKTGRKSKINHVGIISAVIGGSIYFIHASSSKGVIESSLDQDYYRRTFVKINKL